MVALPALLPWQQAPWRKLMQQLEQLPHALLIAGAMGTGKHRFANQLVARLLCSSPSDNMACGVCVDCNALGNGIHPRLASITPESDKSKQLKIEQIRAINPFVQQSSQGKRIVWIDPAEHLNQAAANALLKNLEEPAASVVFVLVCNNPLALLPTIKSRVQWLDIGSASPDERMAYVMQQSHGLSSKDAHLALNLSAQAPLAALELLDSDMFAYRNRMAADWLAMLKDKTQLGAIGRKWHGSLPLEALLQVIQWHLRDILAVHTQQPALQTDIDSFAKLAALLRPGMLLALEAEVYKHVATMGQNIQAELVVNDLAHKMAGIGW